MSADRIIPGWNRPPTLHGRHVRLEPLRAEHAEGLRAAAADGALWTLAYTSVPEPDAILDREWPTVKAGLQAKLEAHAHG